MGFKGKIYEKLPLDLKLKLEVNAQIKTNVQKKLDLKNEKARVYVIGESDNGNVGDLAITVAHTQMIKSIVHEETQIIKILYSDFWKYYVWLKQSIRECDLITIPGGGNIGDVYVEAEEIRQIIIHEFKNNKIIVFPSTVYFLNGKKHNELYKRSLRIYNAHKNLTIYAREKYSYQILKKIYNKNTVVLIPDMVFRYKYVNNRIERKEQILLCLRCDSEGVFGEKEKEQIYSECRKKVDSVQNTDTFVDNVYAESDDKRISFINAKLDEFASAKLIITDRLHGMVLAYLANTPCIVFSNYNYKIKGVYDWIKEADNMKFIHDINELGMNIERLYGKMDCKRVGKMNYTTLENELSQWSIKNEKL